MADNIYTSSANALTASDARTIEYINYECPFSFERKACGSWCALFTKETRGPRGRDNKVTHQIKLECGTGTRSFEVEELSS